MRPHRQEGQSRKERVPLRQERDGRSEAGQANRVGTEDKLLAGGTVTNGACNCARTHKPVKAGKNAWRCLAADPPRNKDASKFKLKTTSKSRATEPWDLRQA